MKFTACTLAYRCNAFYSIIQSAHILAFVAILASCTNTQERGTTEQTDSTGVNEQPARNPNNAVVPEAPRTAPSLTTILLQFENFSMTAAFEGLHNNKGYFDVVHKDTIVVDLGLSSQISGQTYTIKTDSSIQHVEVFQNYETSLFVMGEGPVITLLEWKHYVGDWEKLEIADGSLKTVEYNDADFEQFPDVTRDEIVQAVKDAFGGKTNTWTESAAKCTGPRGIPCGVSISRINLKVVLTYTSGITVERFIVFEVPIGC
ncbi:hypothetical protein [Parachryseolinea silvisoli]|uniref:hypothetical protein n=1 Tax=Parachryseolinea silvisoli TaxID=2873601 RepID=UPI002265F734|nr:hypothetical protein [Parachryseolinea silvisoli]MCD9015597.1 hypothetical protein [Parachryseolinea silvisoli]